MDTGPCLPTARALIARVALLALCLDSAAVVALPASPSSHTPASAKAVPTRLVGYYDAKTQQELPLEKVRHTNLTHIVLTNAVKVDNNGTVYLRGVEHPGEHSAEELIRSLAALHGVKLVVSLRGEPDDVALDELAEVDAARERFSTDAAVLARGWGVSGLEIEWHSDDPAGGKAVAAPFDVMEQYHFALLCRDLASSLRAAGGKTLSVAVRPGRQEFADGNFVRGYIDWLSLRAYSMRSLGDPHHSSLKDMSAALDEWSNRGVPKGQLVLGTPLFGRPGGSLSTAGDRNEALRKSWRELARSGLTSKRANDDGRGDAFVDAETGKVWWVSGINTTKAKVKHVLDHGYGGVAFRDLHNDSPEASLSLVQAARDVVREHREAEAAKRKRRPPLVAQGMALIQSGLLRTKTGPAALVDDEGGKHDEF